MTQAQRGDEKAFGDLARAISGRLYAIAYRVLRDHDDADEATQHAIVAIWRDLPSLRDPLRFEAWAYRIVVNACYSEARRRRHELGPITFQTEPQVPDGVLSVADRDELDRAFRRIPADQRAVLVLQHFLDMGLPEIAEALNVPLGTVKSRSHAGRQALRAALEADARPARGAQPA